MEVGTASCFKGKPHRPNLSPGATQETTRESETTKDSQLLGHLPLGITTIYLIYTYYIIIHT